LIRIFALIEQLLREAWDYHALFGILKWRDKRRGY